MTFISLIVHNISVKKLRLTLTSLAIGIGVLTVVALGVISSSLETSALAIMQTGRADFTIAQKGVADIVSSSINESMLPRIAARPGIADVVGALISTTRLNAANPLFMQIGIEPARLAAFGVTVVSGRAFGSTAQDELMLGWRAADLLKLRIGGRLVIDNRPYRVVGIYSTGQALGDAGAMFPLRSLQASSRQPGQLTLLFVQVKPGTNIAALRAAIERDNPQLVTIRTISDFGRADRSLSLIRAADRGSELLAIAIGAVVVMSAMTMAFIERIREFGILGSIGWSRRRLTSMILGEALSIGVLGAAVGISLSVAAIWVVGNLSSLAGVLDPKFTASIFGRALYTAAAMSLIGGVYPALRAAWTAPITALRHE